MVIGFLIFPGITQLDMTGPYEVLWRLPGSSVHLFWKNLQPIVSEGGLYLQPTATIFDDAKLDIFCVPGGPGIHQLLEDDDVLDFARRASLGAKYIASVCTGALLLGAAGLLQNRRATTHWAWLNELECYGALPKSDRVVVDGNIFTGGGVTAGSTLL
jgi:cyclohexyl-isocyanide hydratase